MNHMGCTRETVRAAFLVLWLLGVPPAVGAAGPGAVDPRAVDPTAAGVEATGQGAASEGATQPGAAVAQAGPEETPATAEEAEATITLEPLEVTSSTATKTELPVFETPFTLNQVPQEVIQDQNVVELKDALKNVSGVVTGFENGGGNDNFTIRGFDLDGVVYRDGVRLRLPRIDPANVERVEVLKGAAASLFGRIEPGGLVNVVTKKPLDEARYSLDQQIAQFDFYRTEADATGPITADASWLYRAVFSYQNNGSFRDFVDNEQVFFAPSVTWNLSPRTQFNLSFEYRDAQDAIDYGIPAFGDGPAPVPIERFFGVRDAESDGRFYLVDFNWSHAFNTDWAIKHKFASYHTNSDARDAGPQNVREDQGLVDVFANVPTETSSDSYFTEIDLTGRFEAAGMTHNLLFGAEYYRRTFDNDFFGADSEFEEALDTDGVIPIRPLDLNNPVYQDFGELPPITPPNYDSALFFSFRQEDYWYAIFAQDFVDVTDKLRFAFFGRYDIARNRQGSCLSFAADPSSGQLIRCDAETQKIADERFTPRVGLSYDIVSWLDVFGNYSQSFGNPAGGFLPDGSPAGYEDGEQGEVGLKTQLFDDQLLGTLTLYHLTRSDVAVPVPSRTFTAVEQAGEERSRGIELDVVGKITDHWSVIGSYAFTDARITDDQGVDPDTGAVTRGREGNRLRNTPEHAFSLWSNYEWPFGLGLGAGVFGATEREVDPDNTVDVPGFVRVDAKASYRWNIGRSKLIAQLNVFNLLDKEIFSAETSFTNTINVVPVAPRTFLGSLRLEW